MRAEPATQGKELRKKTSSQRRGILSPPERLHESGEITRLNRICLCQFGFDIGGFQGSKKVHRRICRAHQQVCAADSDHVEVLVRLKRILRRDLNRTPGDSL